MNEEKKRKKLMWMDWWFNMKLILVFSCFVVDCVWRLWAIKIIFFSFSDFKVCHCWRRRLICIAANRIISDAAVQPNRTCYNITMKSTCKLKSTLWIFITSMMGTNAFVFPLLGYLPNASKMGAIKKPQKIFRENLVFTWDVIIQFRIANFL